MNDALAIKRLANSVVDGCTIVKYPVLATMMILIATQIVNAGYSLNARFLAYSQLSGELSKDLLIRYPLMKKNIGTPGKSLIISKIIL